MWDVMFSKSVVLAKFLKSLVAVVLGNAIYFLVIMPLLPAAGRHGVARIDLGLVIDFWVCLVVFGLIELVRRRKRAGAGTK
jgi:ABC-type uncharacterized transport system permease subunit